MFQGSVVSIHIAPAAGETMIDVPEVEAIPGKGLAGDRYCQQTGTFSKPQADRELTLIESEAIEAFSADQEIVYPAGAARRNVVTRGVPLNHLVGREFQLGEIRVRGLKLCEPCSHLCALEQRSRPAGLDPSWWLARADTYRGCDSGGRHRSRVNPFDSWMFALAAVPPHSAERLRLSVLDSIDLWRLRLRSMSEA